MKKSFRFIFVMILTMIFVCSCTDSAPEIVPEYKIETGDVNFDGLSVTWGFSMSRYMDGVIFSDLFREQILLITLWKDKSQSNLLITVRLLLITTLTPQL